MRTDEITGVRGLLEEFVQEVFASLSRKDQRAKGGLYLQGLMLDGRRKSMQPMGERLGIDYQQLQQFVSSSPWPVEPVRRVLVTRAVELIGPQVWVIDDTGFRKDGPASPGRPGSIRGPWTRSTGSPALAGLSPSGPGVRSALIGMPRPSTTSPVRA